MFSCTDIVYVNLYTDTAVQFSFKIATKKVKHNYCNNRWLTFFPGEIEFSVTTLINKAYLLTKLAVHQLLKLADIFLGKK